MDGYTKLHAVILDSSIWLEPTHVRIVWITMLAMADANGHVEASLRGLAARARVTDDECRQAIASLSGPDPDSRDGTTGERIRQVEPGVWFVINHGRYRERQTRQQALGAARAKRHRQRVTRNEVTQSNGASRAPVYVYASASPPSEGESTREGKPPKERAAVFERPDDVDPQAWKDWLEHRKTKKAPVSETVMRRMRTEAAKDGLTLQEAIEVTITAGWMGFQAGRRSSTGGRAAASNGHLAVPKVTPEDYYKDTGPCDANGWPLDVVNRLDRTNRTE